MKKIILMLTIFLMVGCSSGMTDVLDQYSKEEVISKLDKVVLNVQMFPNKESENELVNYASSICNHLDKFTNQELESIYNKLNFDYQFQYNSYHYERSNYDNCLNKIQK